MPDGDVMRFPSFWRLQALGWTFFWGLTLIANIPYLATAHALQNTLVSTGFMFLGSCLLHPVCRSLQSRGLSWMGFELRALLWSAAIGLPACIIFEVAVANLHVQNGWALDCVTFTVVLFMWCSLYFSIQQWRQSVQEREQAAQERERLLRAEFEAREARLCALRYQLNPHFLFNSLNVVSSLVLDDNAAAATRMLAEIGEFLRATLDTQPSAEVRLSEEIELTDRYLAIEKTRLCERLRVHWAIAPDTRNACVPSLLLQPLVENAVRHGIARVIEGGAIDINSTLRDGRLRLSVRNSGARAGRDARGAQSRGIGLSNVAERLKTLYGNDHLFRLTWPETGGCEVVIELPFRSVADELEAPACEH
jgi:hypothetical protein